ncbi:hypothetical protein SOVF_142470 [Spinacia oleracea]|uniref:Cell division cycle protein 27 homolog B n=1 Tax=Spinacia oleracea TaxID=3562 RepID=A0A9R0IBT3_SPIOL|nr:cell division cycle protein 27 homolog B [Spinacia oleracea]KNA10643.1 hypothetical protein SOVF_142470 [Spinacia oleracea]
MEAILVDSVQNSLRHFMYSNAIFICERLCAEFPSEVNLQLLASCYLQNNQAYAAYHILKGTQMAQSRYLFAFSCFHMDLLNEAEKALSPANESGLEVPNGAAGHYLLGLVYRYTDRRKSAVHHFKQALSIDPLFWAAYEELCVLGSAEEASTVFGESAVHTIQKQQHALISQNFVASTEDQNQVSAKSLGDASPRQLKSIHGNSAKDASGSYPGATASSAAVNQPLNCVSSSLSFYSTPSPMASQLSGIAPPPVCRHVQQNTASASSESSPKSTVSTTLQAPRRKFVDEGKLRKISGRLFSDSIPRRSTRLAGEAGGSTNATTTSSTGNGTNQSLKNIGNSRLSSAGLRSVTLRKGQAGPSDSFEEGIRQEAFDDSRINTQASICTSSSSDAGSTEQDGGSMSLCRTTHDGSKVRNGALEILGLWRLLGDGYRLSCMYKCQEALEIYKKLPPKHYNTSWVLSQVGRAYFELVDYLEADRAFSLARRQCPCSLDGMDVYSTVLYHLKEDMKLSYLAQELQSIDRLAPQTWCAMGNCYSLQKDHDTALKNFQRAVQLNSRFAYAHTLCGHEHVALEDFESGVKSFQNALRVDSRHYNAWYGLGMVYLRQEKFEFAEHHFRVAYQINPHSSVIMSYLGTALHALKRNEDALMMMEKAILADKKNPLPMYQKAIVLSSMENYDAALRVLEELKEYAPRECSIYALIGKIYKRKNMHDKAMLHFGLALDLKPSATDVATIKAAIEKLHVPDDLDDIL